jgi:hypothetical protein
MMVKRCSGVLVLVALFFAACSSSGDSNANSALATAADFCAKCADCVVQPGFSEGFCTPFLSSTGSFDRLKCIEKGDTSQLANQSVTAAELRAWTCTQFDDNE